MTFYCADRSIHMRSARFWYHPNCKCPLISHGMGAFLQSLRCLNLVFYFWGCPTLAWLHKNEIRQSFTFPQLHVFHHCQVIVRWNCKSITIQGMLKIFVLRKGINSFSGAFQNSNPNFYFPYLPHQYIFIFQIQAPSKVKCHRTVLLQGSDSDRKAC